MQAMAVAIISSGIKLYSYQSVCLYNIKGVIMRSIIVSAIAALGMGLATNVFASASGTQVNPSTINLSAAGIGNVGIHTQLAVGMCSVTGVGITAPYDPENPSSYTYFIDNSELGFGVDSVGHIVITIVTWADDIAPTISTGDAKFTVEFVCDGIEGSDSDVAKIVDNSGVNRGR